VEPGAVIAAGSTVNLRRLAWPADPMPWSLDTEVNFGEVAFPQRGTKKKQALYQGTASAVPERDDPDGL